MTEETFTVSTDDQMNRALDAAAGRKRPVPAARTEPAPPALSPAAPAAGGLGRPGPAPRRRVQAAPPIVDDFGARTGPDGVPVPVETAVKFGFLGVGQGGARIAQAFWDLGYRHCGALNTTASDFAGLAAEMPKYSMDLGGAGKDTEVARSGLKSRTLDAFDLMAHAWAADVEWALLTLGLGGGTGSGAGPALVPLVREYLRGKGTAPRVGAIVALPDLMEGQLVARNAVQAFRELLALDVRPLIVMDNARINALYQPSMAEAHPTANDAVAHLLHRFNLAAAVHSRYATFDRSELVQLLDSGLVVMGEAHIPTSTLVTPANVSQKIREDLAENVLAPLDVARGRKGACLFVTSENVLRQLSTEFFEAGFTQLDRLVGSGHPADPEQPTVIHRGIYDDSDDDTNLQCYTMIGALEPPLKRLAELARKGGLGTVAGSENSLAKFLGV